MVMGTCSGKWPRCGVGHPWSQRESQFPHMVAHTAWRQCSWQREHVSGEAQNENGALYITKEEQHHQGGKIARRAHPASRTTAQPTATWLQSQHAVQQSKHLTCSSAASR